MDLAVSQAASTLSWDQTIAAMVIVGVLLIAAGIVVIVGRKSMVKDQDSGLVRGWIAISLVAGLLFFTLVAMSLDDSTLRSTLVGAVAANAGAAVAFYFASKTSDQARQDILDATFGTDKVPDLAGMREDEAKTLLGGTSLQLEVDPQSVEGGVLTSQTPQKDSLARKGSTVRAVFSEES